MLRSIEIELLNHVLDKLNDGVINESNLDEWEHYCFNEDYYIVGYWLASNWLKSHNLDAFEAIAEVIEYHDEHYGTFELKSEDINSETIVNQLVYFYSMELSLDSCTIEDFRNSIEKALEG